MADQAPVSFGERLRELLAYDPETGALKWRERPADLFTDTKQTAAHNCAIWNGRFAGKPALSCPDKLGYLTGHILGGPMKAHRAVWALVYGEMPQGEIDHINGNPADNRLSNLRQVSHAENGRNLRLKRNNTNGVCGIFQRPSGRWVAHITVDGHRVTVGTYDTKDEAARARREAGKARGFHENHGVAR